MSKVKYITERKRAIGINRLKSGEVYADREGKLYLYIASGFYVPFSITSIGLEDKAKWVLNSKGARKGYLFIYMGEDIRDLVENRQRLSSLSAYDKTELEYIIKEKSDLIAEVYITIDEVTRAISILKKEIKGYITNCAKTYIYGLFDRNASWGLRNSANMVASTFASSIEEAEREYYNLARDDVRMSIKKGSTLLLPDKD